MKTTHLQIVKPGEDRTTACGAGSPRRPYSTRRIKALLMSQSLNVIDCGQCMRTKAYKQIINEAIALVRRL